MKRKFIITIACAITALLGNAQAFKATYVYDANGNRTSATIIYLQTSLKSGVETDSLAGDQQPVATSASIQDNGASTSIADIQQVGDKTLKVYPNPTTGLVNIELTGATTSTGDRAYLHSMDGKLMGDYQLGGSTVAIDLGKNPGGQYILRLTIDGQEKTYILVKE